MKLTVDIHHHHFVNVTDMPYPLNELAVSSNC